MSYKGDTELLPLRFLDSRGGTAAVMVNNYLFAKAEPSYRKEPEMTNATHRKAHVSHLYRFCADGWAQEANEMAQALTHDPDNLELHLNLALRYTELEWFDKAMLEFEEGLRLDPNSDFVFAYRGLVKGYLDDYEGAFADFDRCLALRPDCIPAYFHRGRVRFMIKDWEGAIQDYTTVLARHPDDVITRWKRAELYMISDKPQEAFADYRIAINAAPRTIRQHLWQEVYFIHNL